MKRWGPCFWCGRTDRRLTRDHVRPMATGGRKMGRNVVKACGPCNQGRAAVQSEAMHCQLARAGEHSPKTVAKLRRRAADMKALQALWAEIEIAKLDCSPTGAFDLSIPDDSLIPYGAPQRSWQARWRDEADRLHGSTEVPIGPVWGLEKMIECLKAASRPVGHEGG